MNQTFSFFAIESGAVSLRGEGLVTVNPKVGISAALLLYKGKEQTSYNKNINLFFKN